MGTSKTNKNKEKVYIDSIDTILVDGLIQHGISKSLIEYRLENNLNQTQLANKLDVTQAMISKLEDGEYNPTIKQLHKISRKLTNSTEFLIKMLNNILTVLYKNININYRLYDLYKNDKAKNRDTIYYVYTYNNDNKVGGINYGSNSTSRHEYIG